MRMMLMRHAYRHVCRGTSGRNREVMGFFFLLVFVGCGIGLVRYAVLLRSFFLLVPSDAVD